VKQTLSLFVNLAHATKSTVTAAPPAAAAATPQLPYIETASGNRVSRTSVLCAPQRIQLDGKVTVHSGVQLRGDLGTAHRRVGFARQRLTRAGLSANRNWSVVARRKQL
jgi:hypothetical protein